MESIKNFILSLLTWVGDSPLRLFTVILLCSLSAIGWFVYTEKDAFMSPVTPSRFSDMSIPDLITD